MEPIIKVGNAAENLIWGLGDLKRFRKIRKIKGKTWKYFNLEKEPITYTKNSLGYRTHEFEFSGEYIMAFGCSNTYGLHLHEQDRYTNLLEKTTGIKTFNAGVPGGSANMIMMNVASLLASGVQLPQTIIIQWPPFMRLNLPYTNPQHSVKRIRMGENKKTEKIFLDLIKDDIDAIETHSDWAKKYTTAILKDKKIKTIEFAVDGNNAEFYGVQHIERIDSAADDKHCGTKTNYQIAKYIEANL